jgi:hypothetical protein
MMRGRLTVLILVWLLVVGLAGTSAAGSPPTDRSRTSHPAAGADDELDLGRPNLPETRESTTLAPGVTYTRIERGVPSPRDAYTVEVAFRTSRREANVVARRLRVDGFDPWTETIITRAQDDPDHGPLGVVVRVGRFATRAEADAAADALADAGYTDLRVHHTTEDGGRTTGPWVVHVLEVAPRAIDVDAALATDIIPGREQVSSLAARHGAIAATNGGYFVIGEDDGTPGDLAGTSVIDGVLVSEAVDGRTSLILTADDGAEVATLSTTTTATATDGATRVVDGHNREPGLIRSCGGDGGDVPTEAPRHDFTCTDPSELIAFTSAFGATTEPGPGAEAVLSADGVVVEVREPRGGPIPADGVVLAATGDAVEWLAAHAPVGATVTLETSVTDADGDVGLPSGADVVNGGPRLLSDGHVDIPAAAEGFVWPDDPSFFFRFGIWRHPRTLAGVRSDGTLVLVVVDGRDPEFSVGASFADSAAILQSLGAVEGVNLDGGGSSTMVVSGEVVNRPTDATGERPVGDAVVLTP